MSSLQDHQQDFPGPIKGQATHNYEEIRVPPKAWEKQPPSNNKTNNMKIYLAIPYTFNPNRSFEIANKVAAKLMSEGHTVFSPISHSHQVADFLPSELRTDADWWMAQDIPFVDWADEVHIVCIGEYGATLIAESKGCQMELRHAFRNGKPVKIIEYYD
jgi:nucleoside 2-deoxyribosyltransferase